MNEATARQITARLEDEHTERKLAANSFEKEKIFAYTAALANEGGGYFILGVDNKAIIRGTRAYIGKKLQRLKLDILSCQHLSRKLRVEIHEFTLDNKRVLIFQVPSRPIGEAVSFKGAYLMRSGESLVPMDDDTLRGIHEERVPDFSASTLPGLGVNDLSSEAIERAKELWVLKTGDASINDMSAIELLKALELVDEAGAITYAALIILGSDMVIRKNAPNCELVWEYRKDPATIQYDFREEFKQPFLLYFDRLWRTIDTRNEVARIQDGFLIRDLKAFNESVIREAVLNAVTHRDYRDQSSVYIRQSSEAIIISNPGGFLQGVTPENIIEISSKPRNRRIAEVFQKLGLVERSGQGADKIFSQTIAEGKGLPDYSASTSHEVTLEIGAQIHDIEFLKYIERITKETDARLSAQDYVLLERIRQKQNIHGLEARLGRLVDFGLVERIGRGRTTRYILSKRYYIAFGKRGEYTRHRGLDKHTNIELVLKHLALHKKGYIKEFEQVLPHASRATINRYLQQLVSNGKVRLVGNPKITRGKNRSYWELVQEQVRLPLE